ERLVSPKHLSAEYLTRLSRSLIVAARWFAPLSVEKAFDTPLGPVGSLLPVGACYRALRHLPGPDFHLPGHCVFQDAPCTCRLPLVGSEDYPFLGRARIAL